jgi:histone-lysine N-methyltransferase SETD3
MQVVPEFASMATPADFAWARMMVASRNFGIMVSGRRTDALVPLADMLNHHRPRQVRGGFRPIACLYPRLSAAADAVGV